MAHEPGPRPSEATATPLRYRGQDKGKEEERADYEHNRSRSRSRRRIPVRGNSRSISPPIRYRRRWSSPSPDRLEYFDSHHDLFTASTSQQQQKSQDRCVLLGPFTRESYLTTHPASTLDFNTWLPLLALGAPETWPVGLRVPRLAAGAALLPPGPTLKREDGVKPSEAEAELIYLSIQSIISGHGAHTSGIPDLAGNRVTGQSIYRVVKAGSREEAAAQAFYAAGGNRWSTVFTCVVANEAKSSGRVLICDEERYERVNSLEELVGALRENRAGMRVFY
ncbi:uncharacterized protein BDV17DRAFT_295195 [Aspergillus undulatus]|uniref:uncharacterized protein n=1 Tax=Aspergillus undulatus TaxID=1810928 RepID=UPI003CCD43E4